MDSPVQKIKERLGIEEVASTYIKLERAGANLKAKCPFHNEKTPSFFVSPERGTYYCFGCGASGDIFTFVEEFEGLDFKGALKLLAERAGVELPRYNPETESEKEKLYCVMEDAAKFFESNLPGSKNVLAYLKERGLNDESIKNFRIGFVKDDWRELYNHLRARSWSDNLIEKAGLAKKPASPNLGGTDKGYYDRFRGRIMFPISDSSGRVIAFSGRIFEDDGKSAKYLNSPDTPLWSKNAALYGIDRAKDAIRRNNFSILVEGQMDLIMSHQAGYKNAVASSGTALTESEFSKENAVSNLGLVRRLSQNIVLAFDSDEAGEKAALRAGRIALSLGMDVKAAALKEKDPADLILEGGPEAWREAIKKSKHIVEFVLQKILQKENDERKAGRLIREKVLPLLLEIPSAIEQTHFLKKINELAGIPENALSEDLKALSAQKQKDPDVAGEMNRAEEHLRRQDYIRRKLLGLVLWQKKIPEPKLDARSVLSRMAEILGKKPEELLMQAEGEKEDLIFEAEVFYADGADAGRDTEEMLANLQEEILKEKLAVKMRELYLAEEAKDREESARIFKECQAINQTLEDIKNSRLNKKI